MMAATYPGTPASLREFQARFPAQEFARRARLYSAGDDATHIYLLVSGTAKLSKISYTKQPLLSLVQSGELWGESLLTGEDSWTTSAETATAAHIHCFPAKEFHRRSRRDAELMGWIAYKLRQRLQKVERHLELMHSFRVEQRLLLTLADLAAVNGGGDTELAVEIPLTQGELASLVGATRETTSTILNLFERKRWIQLRRGAVYVPSAESLLRAAETP